MSDNLYTEVKRLRNEVQLLTDELAIMKRKYEDIVYNLDTDNFSQRVVKQGKDMYTKIEQTADKISLQAESISELTTSVSALEVTAQGIEMKVTQVEDGVSANTALIEQTAESIKSVVSKNITAYFESTEDPRERNDITEEQKAMLCLHKEKYYYFSDIEGKWKEYPAGGIKTMFKQIADRFELTGDVQISGDLLTSGNISGLTVSTAKNVLGDGVRLNSTYNRLEVLYNGSVVGCWGYTTMPGGSSIYPVGNSTLSIANATASGEWDFSSCTITNWGNNAPVAVFG